MTDPVVATSVTALQTPWFRVRHDEFEHPYTGENGHYFYVQKRPAVIAIAWRHDVIAFVEQYRYPVNARSLELPIGSCDEGEDPLAGAQRELQEETGLTAAAWRHVGTLWEVPGWADSAGHVFLAEDLAAGPVRRDATEGDMRVSFRTVVEVEALVADGVIRDCLTVGALYLARLTAGRSPWSPGTPR